MNRFRQGSVQSVIEFFGGISSLAEQLGVTYQAIYRWKERNAIPPRRAIQIEQLTDGHFRREDLAPEFFA